MKTHKLRTLKNERSLIKVKKETSLNIGRFRRNYLFGKCDLKN